MKTNTLIKHYIQEFKGYWRYQNRGSITSDSGVYCVYAGSYNSIEDTVSLRKLLYIGQSENIRERISNHEKEAEWKRYLYSGEELIFSCTKLLISELDRFEAAMIYKHKPPINTEYVYNFPFPTTEVTTQGHNILLYKNFVV